MQNIIYKIAPLMLLFFAVNVFGQKQSDTFYYYKGEKFFLDIDTKTISISFEGENSINSFKSLRSNSIKIKEIVEDNSRATLVSLDANANSKKAVKSYYMEVSTSKNITIADYYKEIESYKKLPNILMVSPTYTTKSGGELGLSNNFYVKLKDKNDIDILYKKAKEMDLEVLGHDKFMPLWFTLSVTSKNKLNSIQLANIFYETGLFESTEPAFRYHNIETSNDTYFNNQWSLNNTGQNGGTAGIDIKIEEAWSITTGNPSIKTAVYDHGLEMNHPDLQANVYGTGFDANNGTSPATVRGSHGTACAGIIGAVKDNNLGISGVAPTSKLMSISINLKSSDTPSQLASGFNWAWQNGADVISNSWGGYAPSSIIDNAIKNTLTKGREGKGCVIVFAAGNENNTNIRYPGNSNPDLLIVGAMSPCAERKNPNSCDGESNWGSCFGTQLDIVAPGVKMPTTDNQGRNGYSSTDYTQTFNGTSSACPVVAGVAALILSVNPNLTFSEVNTIIEQSAQKVGTYRYATTGGRPNGTWNNQMGYGLVDAHQAVLLAQGNSDSQAPTAPSNLVSTGKTKTSVSLSWTASTDNVGVTGYEIYQDDVVVATVAATSETINGLTANTTYRFKVRAKDAAGNYSAFSNIISVKTLEGTGGDCQKVTGVTATDIKDVSATINWNVADGTTTYIVEYKKTTANAYTIVEATSNTLGLKNLSPETTYQLRIKYTCTGTTGDICEGVAPWRSGVNYQPGDKVVYLNTLYRKTSNSWENLGRCGTTGNAQGTDAPYSDIITFTTKKTPGGGICDGVAPWRSGVRYQPGDKVVYNDTLYQKNASGGWDNLGSCNGSKMLTSMTSSPPLTTELAIYQEPFSGTLSISLPEALLKSSSYRIFDVTGKVIMSGEKAKKIDVGTIENGMYILKISSGKNSYVKRFVKH
ncbi:S8 family serine peptidase [Aquimarina sp. TRL1]|uniref:S8 family serine peptidase n=1 Tax=Aquimarina sp. (strain TRL1) TaxID=2736252 RepID=UPI00158C40AE|nr:S8 family serine peptidase [Aquimarina sp. TRL1]QKX06886.1 S8 family serine peptidase [Aquimarina sp. TRL1]